jgi:CheY-like chemotaxis protein
VIRLDLPMKVLIVEDEPLNVELLLVRLEGLGCDTAVTGCPAEAVALARSWQPDMVLLDLRLGHGHGDMQGVEVLTALRAHPATAAIPVIVHSIYVTHPADSPGALPQADGYLKKPFAMADLRAIVETHRPANTP